MLGGLFEALTFGTSMLQDFREVYPLYGGAAVGSIGFQGGMRVAAIYDAREDGKELLSKQLAAITGGGMADVGLTFEETGTDVVDGLEIHRLAMQIDHDRRQAGTEEDERARAALSMGMTLMFGTEGPRYAVGAEDDRLLMVTGGDDAFLGRAIERFRAGDTAVPPDLARPLDALAAADAGMILRIDVAPILVQIVESFAGAVGGAAPAISAEARSATLPVVLTLGAAGGTWSLSASVVPDGFSKLEEVLPGF